jgi:hypothetical protein
MKARLVHVLAEEKQFTDLWHSAVLLFNGSEARLWRFGSTAVRLVCLLRGLSVCVVLRVAHIRTDSEFALAAWVSLAG